MLRIKLVFPLLLILASLTGCATNLTADIDPNTDLSTINSYYVQKLPADDRGVEKLIAQWLNGIGKKAIHGAEETPPEPVDAIITYQDHWMWDMTMYMLELNVQLRDPKTDYVLASGQTYRTSLVRKTPEGMVAEVMGEIFGISAEAKTPEVAQQDTSHEK